MTRQLLCVLALSYACGVSVLAPSVSRAAESAQQIARVGFVGPASPHTLRSVSAFWERLRELGYVEGQNLVIESRWAEGQYERLPALMAEVVGQKVDVLVTYSTPAALAAKKATSTTPIVAAALGDPVGVGLVSSLAHPAGNLTGLSTGWTEGITAKWLELLREAAPRLTTVAVIENPDNPVVRDQVKELQAVARTQNLRLRLIEVRETGALDHAFEQAGQKAQGSLVLPDPIITSLRGQLVALAAKHRLPTIYYLRDFVDAGGG